MSYFFSDITINIFVLFYKPETDTLKENCRLRTNTRSNKKLCSLHLNFLRFFCRSKIQEKLGRLSVYDYCACKMVFIIYCTRTFYAVFINIQFSHGRYFLVSSRKRCSIPKQFLAKIISKSNSLTKLN